MAHCTLAVCTGGFKMNQKPGTLCSGTICELEECCEPINALMAKCSGQERQWTACTENPDCVTCIPRDCSFGDWADWTKLGGCTGLCRRQRPISQSNNECGRGCKGPQVQTKSAPECMPKECHVKVDCQWSQWSNWTACSSPVDQKKRMRKTVRVPMMGGAPCVGPSKETQQCPGTKAVNCQFSDWGQWTACTATCSGGWRSHVRHIAKKAFGGKACEGVTRELLPCNTQPCGGVQDCQLSQWAEWSNCTGVSTPQKFRRRAVSVHAVNGGKPCLGSMYETTGCFTQVTTITSCAVTQWSDWATCTKPCGGGQTTRTRIANLSSVCVPQKTDLQEVVGCNPDPCSDQKCDLSDWSVWSDCSTTCGVGDRRHTREILSSGVKGCAAILDEVVKCSMGNCTNADCEWEVWQEWSACTCSCGGGSKRRARAIKRAPSKGGRACEPLDKYEVAPCNTGSCDHVGCIDGKWAEWRNWSACSVTCGPGYRMRNRDVATMPNHCGAPAGGLESEFEGCDLKPCVTDVNCTLSVWTQWTTCSCKCFGAKERTRTVQTFAAGNGIPCSDEDLKEISICSPGPGEPPPPGCGSQKPESCTMTDWEDWGQCSASCGGGNHVRTRRVLNPAQHNGDACSGELSTTSACNTQECPKTCVDCQWASWSDWGECSKCGGQRYRHRGIMTMPNNCGKLCHPGNSKEISACKSTCEETRFCVWGPWVQLGNCSADCGPATKIASRSLQSTTKQPADPAAIMFKGFRGSICDGRQLRVDACNLSSCETVPTCTPVNCQFGDWGVWSAPACSGLCTRYRKVVKEAKCGGDACQGKRFGTKECKADCSKPVDCRFAPWGVWEKHPKIEDQQQRTRFVIQEPQSGGKPCEGIDVETRPDQTTTKHKPEDCVLGMWSSWTWCSKTCEGGTRKRHRTVAKEASHGGVPCEGSMKELAPCKTGPCSAVIQACKLSDWTAWSQCTAAFQHMRRREILQEASTGQTPCIGSLNQIKTCGQSAVDCAVSQWTAWNPCDSTCGGGQQHRHRKVTKNPQRGGKVCPTIMEETRGCNTQSCSRQDCVAGSWHPWGPCSATCGVGQKDRFRSIATPAGDGGQGCSSKLSETMPCNLKDCNATDCAWGDWSTWSSCSCDCGGGQQTRDRHVQVFPTPGGKTCKALDKEEMQPCNTQPCHQRECKNGAFEDWSAWELCSKTCGGGLTFRHRKVAREPNWCGKPAVGLAMETMSCHTQSCQKDVNCVFNDWSEWNDCTDTCSGVKMRVRGIQVHGQGNGLFCTGALKQTAPCSTGRCGEGVQANCAVNDWSAWGDCSASCDGGQMHRFRDVVTQPANGGLGCFDPVEEVTKCHTTPCNLKCAPVDCTWGDWGDWSACDKCDGERKRYRHITAHPVCGGKLCVAGASQEISNCTRRCGERQYCSWGAWTAWGLCSATCGKHALKSRTRPLVASATPPQQPVVNTVRMLGDPSSSISKKYEQLDATTRALQMRRIQDLMLCFVGGSLSLVMILLIIRSRQRSRQSYHLRELEIDRSPRASDDTALE